MWTEIRYALRLLGKTPAFTALTVFVLAAGLGTAIYMYVLVRTLAYETLPYPDAERIVVVAEVSHGIELANALPAPLLNDCHGAAQVVTNAAMLLGFSGEDRGGGAMWRIPENPLASATWAITRAGGSVERSSRASSPYEFI